MKTIVTSDAPARAAGELLTERLRARGHQPTLLMLSGGSAFSLLEYVDESVLGAHLTVSVLDERYSTDPLVNNFSQLTITNFYARAELSGATFFDSRPQEGESPTDLAYRFENFLREWHASNPDGKVIATLGMGTDGHTASIFPGYVAKLDAAGKWVEAYSVPPEVNQHQDRITVTPRFLTDQVGEAIAFVIGEEKCDLLKTVTPDADTEQYPVALWHHTKEVTVVTG